jgi:hypothetical protein
VVLFDITHKLLQETTWELVQLDGGSEKSIFSAQGVYANEVSSNTVDVVPGSIYALYFRDTGSKWKLRRPDRDLWTWFVFWACVTCSH